jgi:hypothetical protein
MALSIPLKRTQESMVKSRYRVIKYTKTMIKKKPDDDFHFEFKLKLSPALREFMTITTKLGKVGITIGKILIPPLLAASIASKHLPPNVPQLPLPPGSIPEKNQ